MSSNQTQYDVIIIGGGASGLMCAAVLNIEQPSYKVLVLDQNSKPGRKLLATGNGRCNFTNLNLNPGCYNTDDPDKLGRILNRFPSKTVIGYFEDKLGVIAAYKGDLVYPITYQSRKRRRERLSGETAERSSGSPTISAFPKGRFKKCWTIPGSSTAETIWM